MKALRHILLCLALASPALRAQEDDEAFTRFKQGSFDLQTLSEVMPGMADPAKRAEIRSILLESGKPPVAELVSLLSHPMLSLRLGALEILEELAGGDLTYNPWVPADAPENLGALARWNAWAANPTLAESGALFSDDQRRAYLQDILGEDPDKASRARRMLEAEGLSAVGYLEDFLQKTPTLHAGHRTRIREAQYQITLARSLGDQAPVTARHLAFGSRDQVLAALATIRSAGLLALPILRDFISHPDALVRETSIDALLVIGGEPAVAIVSPLLQKEPDINVIHGSLRRLKDVPGKASAELVASFLSHPDEDLLISAIQTSLSLTGDNQDRFSSPGDKKPPSPADTHVIRALDDPRWRVRATALEYVAKRRLTAAKDKSIELLADPDDFVRFAAIKAISSLGARDALPKLKALFLQNESMAGPVLEGYGSLSQQPDPELLDALDKASIDARLAAIRAVETNSSLIPLTLHFATSPDTDVACAALRTIAANTELLSQNKYASVIVAALKSNDPAKSEAVLERLNLPTSSRIDPRVMQALQGGLANSEPTALDPLYDAFLLPGAENPDAKSPTAPELPQAQAELVNELTRRITPESPAPDRFRAALNLARASHPQGFEALLKDLPSLSTAQKIAIAENLYQPSIREALPLLSELLRSPVPEIRAAAAEATLSNETAPAFLQLILTELTRENANLQPHEIYNYRFESIARSAKLSGTLAKWAIATLESDASPTPLKILATISLRSATSSAAANLLKQHTQSPDPLVRRAATHALLGIRPTEINTLAPSLAKDPNAFVRVVIPLSLNPEDNNWQHHFSDLHILSDNRWSSNNRKPRLSPALRESLQAMASHDASALVRFEAGFALITLGSEIDVEAFASTVPSLPKETYAQRRLSRWLASNATRATPRLRPLLAVIDPSAIQPAEMKVLQAKIQPPNTTGFATFASLATQDPAEENAKGSLLAPSTEAQPAAPRTSIEAIYFFKPGCPECTRAKQYIDAIKADFPLLKIREQNILEASGTILNQALCERFSVPSAKHNISPAIFAQGGFIIRDDINPKSIADLLAATTKLPQDDSWLQIDEQQNQAATAAVDNRYAAFTLPVVIGAGLLDGVNPCAFATIIFFLSYLQIARRTPREMLMVGAAFISAVFIAYLAAGLILYEFLALLNDRFAGIQKWMNLAFATLAIIAAFLSFRDAFRARGGRLGEMTLQLPSFLKDRIRGTIRTSSRARNFVLAAFISGLLISLLELACTGQVYAPIIYQIQQGKLDAVLWLVIYNLAFITPLVVIFLLAYGGLRSENLINFQKKHTFSVKLALGILFFILAAFITWGPRWLAS